MAPPPHPFLLRLVKSGEHSDFTLICKGREFKLHKVIVCPQSPVLNAALCGSFQEAIMSIITVSEFDVATVQHMITFVYTGDYDLETQVEQDRDEQTQAEASRLEEGEVSETSHAPAQDKTAANLLSHLRVNAIADYYNIPSLAKLAISKIQTILEEDINFEIIPQVIQEMRTSNRDTDLRTIIASATAKYIEELTSSHALATVELDHTLAIEILDACGKRIQKLLEEIMLSESRVSEHKKQQEIAMQLREVAVQKANNADAMLKDQDGG
ncbi:hypothetical protein IL306_011869 [Fusarium sp. DS 682]|nr:hypothetical protein IL306_011869 [Fusarium sp. DS 682]